MRMGAPRTRFRQGPPGTRQKRSEGPCAYRDFRTLTPTRNEGKGSPCPRPSSSSLALRRYLVLKSGGAQHLEADGATAGHEPKDPNRTVAKKDGPVLDVDGSLVAPS